MSKFKVGDRVAVYGAGGRCVGEIIESRSALVKVQTGGSMVWYHEKQCRRIKPKREPREIWMHPMETGFCDKPIKGYTHYREVRKAKEGK